MRADPNVQNCGKVKIRVAYLYIGKYNTIFQNDYDIDAADP